jgi:hypothetical protein
MPDFGSDDTSSNLVGGISILIFSISLPDIISTNFKLLF